MARLIWTDEARRWLRDIYEYIAADNPAAALDTVEAIVRRARQLTDLPELGYRYPASTRDVRILLYSHYRIGYELTPTRDVAVLGVFHGAMDLDRYPL